MPQNLLRVWQAFKDHWHLAQVRWHLRKGFPRLYQLYLASKRAHRQNYFEHPNLLDALSKRDDHLQAMESDLQRIEEPAWKVFKVKTAPYVTATDQCSWNSQLFDRFDEAKAYCRLKDQGYMDIAFIEEQDSVKTPDLFGHRLDGNVLAEVKTIRESDDDNDYLMGRGKYEGSKDARFVEHSLDAGLQRKLLDTMRKARRQLAYTAKPANRRLLFLGVQLDMKCATRSAVEDLKEFIRLQTPNDLEVELRIKNNFLVS